MSLVPRFLQMSAALASTAMLAACGGSSEKSRGAEPAGGSPAASAPSNAQDSAQVKLTQCMREQGIELFDTGATGQGFAQMSPAQRERAQAALEGPCQQFASQAFGDTQSHDQDFLDDLTRFTACMRTRGVDVADPDPADPFSVLHSLDQSDPKIAAAMPVCQDKLAALNGGG